ASDVTVTAADGSATTLAKLKGAPLVVNMWATWCHPCVTEMPAFDSVAGSIGSGVQIIGVNVADDAAAASAFATKLGVHYRQYTDPDGNLSTAFNVSNLPATVFVAADGTVLEVHSGAFTADTLKAAIEQHFPGATGGTTK
ncbi:MAG: TlpA disulfide reductase family protein, partial [Actinomycetota bacterium]